MITHQSYVDVLPPLPIAPLTLICGRMIVRGVPLS